VAHDFSNLLTIITSYAEFLLADTLRDDPRARDLGEIQKAAEAATTLTRQLLAFSRPRAVRRDVVDLNEVIVRSSNLVTRLLGENITITLRLHPDAGVVEADASQIEQVAINLIVNARDAMPDGGSITIETRGASAAEAHAGQDVSLQSSGYVMLSVADTGTGMDETTQSHIFEPFFSTKGEANGTGLGLATVSMIVTQHRGVIRVASALGRGTAFRIYLPLTEEMEALSTQQ
jgi:signal transduction histidine kinase